MYGDDAELLDLQAGCLAEPKPAGFAIGNTAFQIFIVMASRRLETDTYVLHPKVLYDRSTA